MIWLWFSSSQDLWSSTSDSILHGLVRVRQGLSCSFSAYRTYLLHPAAVTPGLTIMTGFFYTRKEIPLRQCVRFAGSKQVIDAHQDLDLVFFPRCWWSLGFLYEQSAHSSSTFALHIKHSYFRQRASLRTQISTGRFASIAQILTASGNWQQKQDLFYILGMPHI